MYLDIWNVDGDNKSCHGHHYVNTLLNKESGEIFISNTKIIHPPSQNISSCQPLHIS